MERQVVKCWSLETVTSFRGSNHNKREVCVCVYNKKKIMGNGGKACGGN